MCNLYRMEKNPDAIRRLFADVQIPITFPEGIQFFFGKFFGIFPDVVKFPLCQLLDLFPLLLQ